MILRDRPIIDPDDDLFDRREFAKHLAGYLCSMAKGPSCVVALRGKWGSGKTSLINMTEEELKGFEGKPVIVKFNPWTCTSTDRLVVDFLHALRSGLANCLITETVREKADKVLKAIERYAAALVPLDISMQLSGIPFSSAGAARKIADSARSLMMGEDDVETCKKSVSDELSFAFENVVVVIDDIDRLPNDRICLLFQLVAQIADFPNVHYLLAYDADIVEDAIRELQGGTGRDYLEKIVQLPIDIPQVPQSVLRKQLRRFLQSYLSRFGVSEEGSEAFRADEVIEHAVMPSIRTMRDYKRFSNAFEFEISFIGDGISIVDLIALVAIKQFYPEVASWMDSHMFQLCGSSTNSFVPHEASDFKNSAIEQISKILREGDAKAESVVEALINLFPRFAGLCGTISEYVTIQELRMKSRVACEDVYMRYRLASLGSWGYPREAIRVLLNDASRSEIANALETGLAGGFSFAEEASGLIGGLSSERAVVIAGGALDSIQRSRSTNDESSHGDSLEPMLKGLLKKCGKEDSQALLSSMISESTLEGLVRISHLINTEELMHGRLVKSIERPERQLLSSEGLVAIEDVYARKIGEVSKICNLLTVSGVGMLLYLWGELDRKAERQYITHSLATNEHNLIYLCRLCAGPWLSYDAATGNVITGWSPNRGAVERYLDLETTCETIDRIRNDSEFWEFEETALQAVAATYLMVQHGIPRPDDSTLLEIDQKEVVDLLDRWREEHISTRVFR